MMKNLILQNLRYRDARFFHECRQASEEKKCSTSPPGGNQVDGLPPASSFKNWDILVSLGAQTQDSSEFMHSFLICIFFHDGVLHSRAAGA